MLRARDVRGWLHLFSAETILEMQKEYALPAEMVSLRPALQLAARGDAPLHQALLAEQQFWKELDRLRIRILRAALKPFVLAMGKTSIPANATLSEQHAIRLAVAEQGLEKNPVAKFGVARMIEESRAATTTFVNPQLMQWLPDVSAHFRFLTQ